jgi:hypothetical protein
MQRMQRFPEVWLVYKGSPAGEPAASYNTHKGVLSLNILCIKTLSRYNPQCSVSKVGRYRSTKNRCSQGSAFTHAYYSTKQDFRQSICACPIAIAGVSRRFR